VVILLLLSIFLFYLLYTQPEDGYFCPGFLPAMKVDNSTWKITISDCGSLRDLSKFKVIIQINNKMGLSETILHSNKLGTYFYNGTLISFSYIDLDGNSKFNKGDYFVFEFSKVPTPGIVCEVKLLWGADNSVLGSKSFTI
jgi:hypothetical protein